MSVRAHDAPLLTTLLTPPAPASGRRILDLGPAAAGNFSHYARSATSVRFIGLDARDVAEIRGLGDAGFARRLEALLPVGRETFDVILAWTLLDYLGSAHPARLCDHLAAVAAPRARLHAMISMSAEMPAEPDRFEIVDGGTLVTDRATAEEIPAPETPPARLERWLRPFSVESSVILRHGVREVVAVVSPEYS